MKTIYHSKNNRARKQAYVATLAVILLIIGFVVTGLFSKAFYKGMVFLSAGKSATGQTASSFFSLFSSRGSLENQNQSLKDQLALADVQLADRNALAKENGDLKASLHLQADTNRISAQVLSKPPFAPFDVLIIEGGTDQGINVGNLVMVGEDYIGKVSSASAQSSQVTLLSSPDQKIDAYVGDSALPAVFSGKGGGNFEASLPEGSAINEGDTVFTTVGQDSYYVGDITKIINNDDNTFTTLLLNLPVNLYELSYVEIIPSQ